MPAALLAEVPPIYMADADRRLVFTTPAFEAMAAMLFELEEDALDPANPPPALDEVFDRLDSAPGQPVVAMHRIETRQGLQHLRARHQRIMRDGAAAEYVGVYTDATAEVEARRKAAAEESRYQDILRSTADWVWETDANLNFTAISSRIADVLDQLPSTLIGRNLFSLGRFEDTEDASRSQRELLFNLVPFRGRLFLVPERHGGVRLISLAAVPVFEESTGRFAGYRGTGTDVTHQQEFTDRGRNAQLELLATLEELRERNRQHELIDRGRNSQLELLANIEELRDRNIQLDIALDEARSLAKEKTEFLGKMSHELRTPLNAIIGFSEMSVRQMFGPLNEHYLGYFRDIGNAAHHLLSIINDILDAVSVEFNHVTMEILPVRISTVIAEARSLIMVRAQQKGVDISAVDMERDYTVLVDARRTRQIFLNLLSNAVKCTEPGGKVGVEARQHGPDAIYVTVWDTGIGIPEDQLERIFESFHQVRGALMTSPSEGTGLGLSVSRQLARLMGGDITVISAPGHGARFTVRLPLVSTDAAAG